MREDYSHYILISCLLIYETEEWQELIKYLNPEESKLVLEKMNKLNKLSEEERWKIIANGIKKAVSKLEYPELPFDNINKLVDFLSKESPFTLSILFQYLNEDIVKKVSRKLDPTILQDILDPSLVKVLPEEIIQSVKFEFLNLYFKELYRELF